jgi:hypothetical protein
MLPLSYIPNLNQQPWYIAGVVEASPCCWGYGGTIGGWPTGREPLGCGWFGTGQISSGTFFSGVSPRMCTSLQLKKTLSRWVRLTMWAWPVLQGFETGQHPSRCRRSLQAGWFWDVQGRDSEWRDNHHILWDSRLHSSRGKTLVQRAKARFQHYALGSSSGAGRRLWKSRMNSRKEKQ